MSTEKTIRILNLNKQVLNAENLGEHSIKTLKDSLLLVIQIACKLHKDNDGDAEYLTKTQSRLDASIAGLQGVNDIINDLSLLREDPSIVDSVSVKYAFALDAFNLSLDK